jgi:hypothetical protein
MTHSGAAYAQENFRGFKYIHQTTYSPPDPRVTYDPPDAGPYRPQPATGNLLEPGERTQPHESRASDDDDIDDDIDEDGLATGW